MLVRFKLPALLDPELEGEKYTAVCKVMDSDDKILATHTFIVKPHEAPTQRFSFNMTKLACGIATDQITWIEKLGTWECPIDYVVNLGAGVEPHMDLTINFYRV